MIDKIGYESPLGRSDHVVLTFKYKCYFELEEATVDKWNFHKGDYIKMTKELDKDWSKLLNDKDPNVLNSIFLKEFNAAKDKCIPKLNRKAASKAKKHNYLPLDDKTREKIRQRHRCWQRYMETRDNKKYEKFKKIRNQVKSLVKKAKQNMEKDIAKNAKTNPKKFWQYANSKRKTKSGIAELKYKNDKGEMDITKCDEDKANVLANFFSSVFTNEPEGDMPKFKDANLEVMFEEGVFEEKEVKKLLNELNPNKSKGPDCLHPKALKELQSVLTKPLTRIFNASKEEAKLPEIWKIGNVVALFKKGDKPDPGNYRPVSLTSIACKMMEKLVRNQIVEHIKRNKLLSKKQFGFISGRSTTLQLLLVLDHWTEILDNGGSIDSVYMDFMKAFDKVPHRRLIKKMKHYGIGEKTLNWVQDFLSNRKQKVSVNGMDSTTHNVTSGIPQGSVLGPILFVIYINDMPDCVAATAYLFADDTKLYKEIKSPEDSNSLQRDLDSLQEWSNTWLLKFHPNKCKVMTVSNKKNINRAYHLYDSTGKEVDLEKSEGEKDIGVFVDDQLTFSRHIQQQANKANSIMGLIRRTYSYLDEQSFKYLFQALVRPHLEYAEAVWSPSKVGDIDVLENVQRRATKQIPSLKNLEYSDRLKKLKMPTLKYRRLRGDMIETFKIINGIYDRDVTENFLEIDQNTRTRGNDKKLKKKYSKLNIRKFSFTNRIVDIWNNLPNEVIKVKTVKSFEMNLDKYWETQELKYDHTANINLISKPGCDVKSWSSKIEEEVDIVASSQRPQSNLT